MSRVTFGDDVTVGFIRPFCGLDLDDLIGLRNRPMRVPNYLKFVNSINPQVGCFSQVHKKCNFSQQLKCRKGFISYVLISRYLLLDISGVS